MSFLFLLLYWYWILILLGLGLLCLRDDFLVILNDVKKGINKGIMVAFFHISMLLALMPLTIPFSIFRIFKK